MIRGALSHLDFTITDPARSVPFYQAVLSWLGYHRMPVEAETTANACWAITDAGGSRFSIGLEPARGPGQHQLYNRYAPGLHHVAFHVDSRADVDQLYAQLLALGAEVLAPPTAYAYTPGYYAVACRDPDGLVLEFLCMNPTTADTSAEMWSAIAASRQVLSLKEAIKRQNLRVIPI